MKNETSQGREFGDAAGTSMAEKCRNPVHRAGAARAVSNAGQVPQEVPFLVDIVLQFSSGIRWDKIRIFLGLLW